MNQQETNKLNTSTNPSILNNDDNDNKLNNRYLNVSLPQIRQRDKYVDAPRQIPKKSYSLAADMINGWRPRKTNKINFQNVFPLNFTCDIIDQIVKALIKKNLKYQLVYLGPRKPNSYMLHQHQIYQNPYPIDKRVDTHMPQRPGISKSMKLTPCNLHFDSDFESGNLDIAVKISDKQYDLFMRVDTNTRGHTNWFYFKVENGTWLGTVKFNICNFRRQRSLYQRGMKPYICSLKQGNQWVQKGSNIEYLRKSLRYKFLYEQDESFQQLLSTYYTMTFTYNFDQIQDKVEFAYCIPYTYTQLFTMIRQVSYIPTVKYETGWRTLSGLPVPVLQITNFQQPNYSKKVVLITARVHPGQSNSSYVCDGLIKSLCSQEAKIKEMLKKFHFYIVPMLNPDGVVAGNYRTSLFGKDLNRTFNQSRKYAFPQTFNLIQYAKNLKKQHKQRFTIYLDLHGHSTKKNSFFYGPDYGLAHSFYTKSREFAKILGNLTTMFRYYSCVFHISNQKTTTARATFNRVINIPFTYTLQASNGAYYDSIFKTERPFTAKSWKQIGGALVRGLNIWAQTQNFTPAKFSKSIDYIAEQDESELNQQKQIRQKQPPGKQPNSDDQIGQGKSDSQPQGQDFNTSQLQKLQKQIEGKKETVKIQQPEKQKLRQISPQKSERPKQSRMNFDWSTNLRQSYNSNSRKKTSKIRKQRLPPINLQINPVQFLGNISHKKRITIVQALKNLTVTDINPKNLQKSKRLSISQMMINQRQSFLDEQHQLLLQKKCKRNQRIQKLKRKI